MTTQQQSEDRHDNRIFWPVVLIAIGLIWLLRSLNVLSSANLNVMLNLWPLALIVMGLTLVYGQKSADTARWIVIGGIGVALIVILVGPLLGWGVIATKAANFEEAIDEATAAEVRIDPSLGTVTVNTVADSNQLITADLKYVGEVAFDVTGDTIKNVHLYGNNRNETTFNGMFGTEDQIKWDINLTENLPMNLNIRGGVGFVDLNLSNLQLTGLQFDGGVGDFEMTLPSPDKSYTVTVNGGVGSGTIDVPDDVAVQLTFHGGLGDANVPGHFIRTDSNTTDDDNGVWQTENFTSADLRILIEFNGGVGGLTVR